ncbi:MAG: hypothetical protein JOZ41_17735 [Chloroflexi bacterium]|nr:hypothetical protein [Chloroflexota bacterium]
MDASRHSQDLINAWFTEQQKLLTNWMAAMQGLGGGQGARAWRESLETWQRSVETTLDAQNEWIRRWNEAMRAPEGVPPQVSASFQQAQELLQRWTDAQRDLWRSWFDVMKELQPGGERDTAGDAGQSMMRIWQDATQRVIDAQTAWVRRWMPGPGSPGDER